MKKKVVQDVIPPKKSIRNIEMPSRPSRSQVQDFRKDDSVSESEPIVVVSSLKADPAPKKEVKDVFTRPVPIKQAPIKIEPLIDQTRPPITPPNNFSRFKYEDSEPKKPSKVGKYVTILIVLCVLAFGISYFFKSAEIRITPKQDTTTINDSFTAKKDATGSTLGFQIVTITKDVTKPVPQGTVTTDQQVDKKAQGKIIIYNNFDSNPQPLIATTRFQTPEGLVYRLISDTVVPGRQTVQGKTTAGSIEVSIEADKSGASYNIGLKDFTLPGLKGTTKYSAIYARSKTEMTGGFSGTQKLLSKDVLSIADAELETSLKASLSNDVTSQIPADYVLYPSSLVYKLDAVSEENQNGVGVLVKKGTANAIIFDKGSLTRTILAKVMPNVDNSQIKITNLDSLSFAYSSTSASVSNTASSITFSLKGDANLVWTFDENKLKNDVLGLSKSEANTIIATYGSIKEAWVLTRPFWNQTIPKNPAKVTLINTLTK